MGKLVPILLALVGLGGGIGAGLALRPHPEPVSADEACPCDCAALTAELAATGSETETDAENPMSDFVKLNNQFVIPVITSERVGALVVLSITLEVPVGGAEPIYQREPKLRDVFLQLLFDHANAGGFDGAFTEEGRMETLRTALLETARRELGNNVKGVLITDIARQDI